MAKESATVLDEPSPELVAKAATNWQAAKEAERLKRRYRFHVSVAHPKEGKLELEVVAVDEPEAWALFCDAHPKVSMPNPKIMPRTFKKLGVAQVRDES